MHKLVGVIVPLLVSFFVIQAVGELLLLRATQSDWARGAPARSGPAHEVDRDAVAGAMFT
jgi:hypothetical protein